MSTSDTVFALIELPRKMHVEQDKSPCALVEESGYLESHEQVSEDVILRDLREHPECLREWKIYSEDKRTTGWYLVDPDVGPFCVGFIPAEGENLIPPLKYPDEATACAAFIKREIEDIRKTVLELQLRQQSRRKRRSTR